MELIYPLGKQILIEMTKIVTIFFIVLFASCNSTEVNEQAPGPNSTNVPPVINYSVVSAFPHDTTAFTEGLLIHDGLLFESTGHTDSYPNSRSLFGILDLHTGRIETKVEIDKNKYFGEGIVFLKDRVYQLTDTTRIGFIYDGKTYKKMGEFHYDSDGWGFTTNGSSLIMSDGSSNISFRDPLTFKTVKTLPVTDNNGPVNRINELELINGFIYANEWLTNYILKIDTSSGKVVGKLDLSSLSTDARSKYPGAAEMNGIAYDSVQNKIYVTGKLWPTIYEIKFSH